MLYLTNLVSSRIYKLKVLKPKRIDLAYVARKNQSTLSHRVHCNEAHVLFLLQNRQDNQKRETETQGHPGIMEETSGNPIGVVIFFVIVFVMTWKIRQFINDLKWVLMTSLLVTILLLAILHSFTGSLSLSGIIIAIPLCYFIMKLN